MPVINRIASFHKDMTAWRHDIHKHPETAFEEVRTADIVADKLGSFGLEVHRGLAKTGVVGVLRWGTSKRAIGLRADMDALDVHETNTFAHASTIPGKMHACGHDGHTTMLLGAASTSPRRRTSTARFISSSSPPRRTKAAGASWSRRACLRSFPAKASTACTTFRAYRSATSLCSRAR